MNNSFKKYWPAIIWSAIIFLLLAIPGSDLPGESSFFSIPHADKWVHIALFAFFVILWCRAVVKWSAQPNRVAIFLLITAMGILFGYLMELVQKYFITNRDYDLWDVIADAAGSIFGLVFSLLMYRKK